VIICHARDLKSISSRVPHAVAIRGEEPLLKTWKSLPAKTSLSLPLRVRRSLYGHVEMQRFDFRRSRKRISRKLKNLHKEGIGYYEGVFIYAVEADGSLRDAESMLARSSVREGILQKRTYCNIIGIVERDILYRIIRSIFDGSLKEGLELIEKTLGEGYDIHQIYRGLVSFLRNMMLIKVCEGIPSFLYIGEEEFKRVSGLLQDVEYYEIQNMLHYMLRAEDLLKGIFPKVSLEILYINLYNLSKLRDVEKVLDDLERRDPAGVQAAPDPVEGPVAKEAAGPPRELSAQFCGMLRKGSPLWAGVFEKPQGAG